MIGGHWSTWIAAIILVIGIFFSADLLNNFSVKGLVSVLSAIVSAGFIAWQNVRFFNRKSNLEDMANFIGPYISEKYVSIFNNCKYRDSEDLSIETLNIRIFVVKKSFFEPPRL